MAEASGSIKEVASDAESEGSQTAPPAYTTKDLKAAIKSMTTEDKEKFLDDMALDSDQDFWKRLRPGCGQYVHTECILGK